MAAAASFALTVSAVAAATAAGLDHRFEGVRNASQFTDVSFL